MVLDKTKSLMVKIIVYCKPDPIILNTKGCVSV